MTTFDPALCSLYSTLAGYVAALETHGATAGDIPLMLARLREASDQLEAARVEDRSRRFLVDTEPTRLTVTIGHVERAKWLLERSAEGRGLDGENS